MLTYRQRNANIVFFIYFFVAILIVGFYRLSLKNTILQLQETSISYLEVTKNNRMMETGSDSLTKSVSSFVVTHDLTYLRSYWNEVEISRSRDKVIEELSQLNLDIDEELVYLRKAKAESDKLILTETRAMKLVSEAVGYKDWMVPLKVAEYELSAADKALANEKKLALALELVFGSEYQWSKDIIMSNSREFVNRVNQRYTDAIEDAGAFTLKAYSITTVAFVLLIAGFFLFLLLNYFKLTRPILRFTQMLENEEAVDQNEPLPLVGVRELQQLAWAYNHVSLERSKAIDVLKLSENKLKQHFDLMPIAAIELNLNYEIISWNPEAFGIFGFSKEEAVGRNIFNLILFHEKEKYLPNEMEQFLLQSSSGEKQVMSNWTKAGELIKCEWHGMPIYDSAGDAEGWLIMIKDVTVEKMEAERILFLSTHDPLTGLYNRRYMIERLNEEILRRNRIGLNFALIMLDVDHFKLINDNYSHECGDLVLKRLSEIIGRTIRMTDILSRWGGEEFLILLPDTYIGGAVVVAEKIRKAVESEQFTYNEKVIHITITAGVVTYSRISLETSLREVDQALLYGKNHGRNIVVNGDELSSKG